MEFPRCVYKLGTGKKVNDNGLFAAESVLVKSAEELDALGADWCDSPAEAVAEPERVEKPAKKVK